MSTTPEVTVDNLRAVIEKHWGYREFRPLQQQAMQTVLDGRDSLVVLPTGGGKSLCYQAPAVALGGTTVVISPLISLMKDQVDSLRACGIAAAQIDSSLSSVERHAYQMDIMQRAVRLVFVSPERIVMSDFRNLLAKSNVRAFAIDEAHCISHWGHDFRPEYRQMRNLKEWFPNVSVHGYTATATEIVREVICKQLALDNPEVLVGDFDRPNLNYSVLPRVNHLMQALEFVKKHQGEPGIIYCLRRRDVDELATYLQQSGISCLPYHAGKDAHERKTVQEAFSSEKCNLIVATIAFGMGIDRSNIRFVLHAGMPKSIEHYQQETGRAGRDGLEADCTLLYSGEDNAFWDYVLTKSAQENNAEPTFLPNALNHLRDMDHFCKSHRCRHKTLVNYFGQTYTKSKCDACDVCLGDTKKVKDGQTIARKILSCVARVEERFGAGHVISVLRGENLAKVRKFGHEKLSTYGILNEHTKSELRDWIFQLIGQDVLAEKDLVLDSGQKVTLLGLNDKSWEVMKNERQVTLREPVHRQEKEKRPSKTEQVSWEGVDRELFEDLRELRRELAEKRGVPPFVIFGDKTLREMASNRPSTLQKLHYLYGVGEQKLNDFGMEFLDRIKKHCEEQNLDQDVPFKTKTSNSLAAVPKPNKGTAYVLAMAMFGKGASIKEVAEKVERKVSTVSDYLREFILTYQPRSIARWVDDETYAKVREAVNQLGADRLKPIYLKLEEKVPYEQIRLVVAHLAIRDGS